MITKYTENKELNENVNEDFIDAIDESVQIGDTVKLDKQKGFVIGQMGDGDLIIQVQGSSHRVAPNSKKLKTEKQEPIKVEPHMKFDKVSLKLLFEQFVKCGVYVGNTPVKIDHCYTKFSDYNSAKDEEVVSVMIEGHSNLIAKNQIRIFEDVNEFANVEGYVPGVEIDETTEEVLDSIMINATDYANANGDADMVRIIRQDEDKKDDDFDGQTIETKPKAHLRTLSV